MPTDQILSRSEFCDLLYDVIDDLYEGIQVLDHEGRYLYLNKTAAQHGKREPQELIGKTMIEMYPGTENSEMYQKLLECLETKQHLQMLNQFTFPDGSTGWFKLSFEPIEQGVMILSMDVTDMQKKILRQQEEDLHRKKM